MNNSEDPRPPLADDLSFLADLDRGLDNEGSDGLAPPLQTRAAPEPMSSAAAPSAAVGSTKLRRRPLLELFPPSSPTPAREAPALVPAPTTRAAAPAAPARPERRAPLRVVPQRMVVAESSPLTYEIFYGLPEKPFSPTSDPKFLYHSTSHDRVAQELLSAIGRRDQFVILTGEVGSGKTTLCRAVMEQIDRRTFTSFVADPFVTVEDLLKTILIDFGVISRADLAGGRLAGATRHELTLSLREFLASLGRLDAFAVVFIDEAHNLTPDMLGHIGSLADLEDEQRLLQIVLVGESGLYDVLDRPELAHLLPRVAQRSVLEALSRDEIGGYVSHRLAIAGRGQSRVEFEDEAFVYIHELSGGIPRLVNRICDRALALGFEESASLIDEGLVEAAARDLDMIPPERPSARTLRVGLAVVALLALMAAGAGLGLVVFRDEVAQVKNEWTAAPPPPAAPRLRLAAPIVPLPMPANDQPRPRKR